MRLRAIGVWLADRRDDSHPWSELAPDRCTAVAATDAGRSARRPARARGLAHAAVDADKRACSQAEPLPLAAGRSSRAHSGGTRPRIGSTEAEAASSRETRPGGLRPLRRTRSPGASGERHPRLAPARRRLRALAAAGRSRSTHSARQTASPTRAAPDASGMRTARSGSSRASPSRRLLRVRGPARYPRPLAFRQLAAQPRARGSLAQLRRLEPPLHRPHRLRCPRAQAARPARPGRARRC